MNRLATTLLGQRSLALLIIVSFGLSASSALTLLPMPLILGRGFFWDFPRGSIPGSASDMADGLVGYLYFVRSPWTFPFLYVPNLGAPVGTNIFWIADAIPWVSLLGKLIYASTGVVVNLLGFYLFACFALGGIAMTVLIATAGQRNLFSAITGSVFGTAMPFFLFRWGHMTLAAQFLIVFALGLYLQSLRTPRDWRVVAAWLGLLSISLLTNAYLFIMAGGCWAAAQVQRRLNGDISTAELAIGTASVVVPILSLMLVAGILSVDLRFAGSDRFGIYSMNLASPFVPQMSGVIPMLADYRVGPAVEYEGFCYLGLGVLALLTLNIRAAVDWIRRRTRSHVALISVLALMSLLATSNRVYLGHHLLLAVPLPPDVAYTLGAVRSSGRFFWLVGYAIAAGAIVLTLRCFQTKSAICALGLACVIQLIDVQPIRQMIAATTEQPVRPTVAREAAAALIGRSTALMIFPSFGCVRDAIDEGFAADSDESRLRQANMEFALLGARANLPINSTYNARLETDCRVENAARRESLRSGTLYIYMASPLPSPTQLQGRDAKEVCSALDWINYCLIPSGSSAAER